MDSTSADVTRDLENFQRQAQEARAELTRLQLEVAEAEKRLRGSRAAAELLEANQHLVVAAIQAQADAETSKRALNEVTRSAELDPLTGLPNRVLLLDRFAHAISNARRRNTRLAVLFLDLDHFKQINDTLGHAFGDEVLKRVASCLTSTVRGSDTVCRIGGDEFVILLDEISHPPDAMLIAEKVLAAFRVPRRFGDHLLGFTASIGISIYPDDGEDPETLMDRADAAMYSAKKNQVGSFAFHREETTTEESAERTVPGDHQLRSTFFASTVTEHDRLHIQLREANEQLVLAALGAQAMQAAAEEAQRRQTEFMAVLAHELRNPLMPISTSAALLGWGRMEEPMLRTVQATIERQVAHISRLVRDLLDVSRLNTGKLRLERRVVDMVGVLHDVIDSCRPSIDTRKQHLAVRIPPGEFHVHGDPLRLAQVFSNLLDNASKYTPNGGAIAIAVEVVDDSVVTTVSDSGIGITPEALPVVFDLFAQDRHATEFSGEGLGIGLTIARELVLAHGGSVTAHSAGAGLGSRFVVSLPMTRHSAFQKKDVNDD